MGGVRVWKVVFRCWGFMVFSLSLSSFTSPTSHHVWLDLAGLVLMGELGNEAVVFSCKPCHRPVDEWATKVPSPRLCQPAVLPRYGISPDPRSHCVHTCHGCSAACHAQSLDVGALTYCPLCCVPYFRCQACCSCLEVEV